METPIIDSDGEEETGTFRMRTDRWVAAAWTWNWRLLSLLSRSVQSISSFRHHALCIVGKTFPIYKITKQISGSRKIQTNKQTNNNKKTSVRIHAIARQLVRSKNERPFRLWFFEWNLLFKISRKEWKYPSEISLKDDDDHRWFTDTSNPMLTMQGETLLTPHCNKQWDHTASLSKSDWNVSSMLTGCCLLLFQFPWAVSKCEHCVGVYHTGANGIANPRAKQKPNAL